MSGVSRTADVGEFRWAARDHLLSSPDQALTGSAVPEQESNSRNASVKLLALSDADSP